MAATRTTQTLAPDSEKGPFRITVTWRVLRERFEAVGIAVEFADQSEARALQTRDLRALRLPLIVERAAEELRRQLDEQEAVLKAAAPERHDEIAYLERLLEVREAEEARQAATARRAGRPGLSVAELERVAQIYFDAFYNHEPPTKAVAEQLAISHSAATKRIAKCRKHGLLGPAERGKASAGALIGRGDASSTRSLIAIKKELARRRAQRARLEGDMIKKTSAPNDTSEG